MIQAFLNKRRLTKIPVWLLRSGSFYSSISACLSGHWRARKKQNSVVLQVPPSSGLHTVELKLLNHCRTQSGCLKLCWRINTWLRSVHTVGFSFLYIFFIILNDCSMSHCTIWAVIKSDWTTMKRHQAWKKTLMEFDTFTISHSERISHSKCRLCSSNLAHGMSIIKPGRKKKLTFSLRSFELSHELQHQILCFYWFLDWSLSQLLIHCKKVRETFWYYQNFIGRKISLHWAPSCSLWTC